MKRLVMLLMFLFFQQSYAEKKLSIDISIRSGSGDDPMIVMWLEKVNKDGKRSFVKTINLFSHDYKYYKELNLWRIRKKQLESDKSVDAIVASTIQFNRSRNIKIPVNFDSHNLLDGTYMIRTESGRKGGKRYRTLKLEIPKGLTKTTYDCSTYIKKITLSVSE